MKRTHLLPIFIGMFAYLDVALVLTLPTLYFLIVYTIMMIAIIVVLMWATDDQKILATKSEWKRADMIYYIIEHDIIDDMDLIQVLPDRVLWDCISEWDKAEALGAH